MYQMYISSGTEDIKDDMIKVQNEYTKNGEVVYKENFTAGAKIG